MPHAADKTDAMVPTIEVYPTIKYTRSSETNTHKVKIKKGYE